MKSKMPPAPPGFKYVFRAWRRDPQTGTIVYASQFGKKAFCFLVPE